MFSAQGSGIKSVSGDNWSLELLGLELTTRSTTSLCESVSTSESEEKCTFPDTYTLVHYPLTQILFYNPV